MLCIQSHNNPSLLEINQYPLWVGSCQVRHSPDIKPELVQLISIERVICIGH
jgi:hypothetical protein